MLDEACLLLQNAVSRARRRRKSLSGPRAARDRSGAAARGSPELNLWQRVVLETDDYVSNERESEARFWQEDRLHVACGLEVIDVNRAERIRCRRADKHVGPSRRGCDSDGSGAR